MELVCIAHRDASSMQYCGLLEMNDGLLRDDPEYLAGIRNRHGDLTL